MGDSSACGYHLKFVTFVPTARHPEPQVKFRANLSEQELAQLHEAIGLATKAVRVSRSPGEPVAAYPSEDVERVTLGDTP